jgi:hypothetical protein
MHYLSLLVQLKNDALILKEWLEHHKWQGFDHIYIIDNGSTDNLYDVAYPFVQEGFVTVFNLPGDCQRVNNYNIVFNNIKNNLDWLAVSDINEYWYTPQPYGSVKAYLEQLEKEDIQILYTPRYTFGSNGYKEQPTSIRTSFIRRAPTPDFLKSIVKASFISKLEITQHAFNAGCTVRVEYNKIKLNHYAVMSKDYFAKFTLVNETSDSCEAHYDWNYFKNNDINVVLDADLQDLILENNQQPGTKSNTEESIKKLIRERALNYKQL